MSFSGVIIVLLGGHTYETMYAVELGVHYRFQRWGRTMRSYRHIWLFQCPDAVCSLAGFINNVVLDHWYSNGVPCPRCGRDMNRIRPAAEGEFDADEQEMLAIQARGQEFKVVPTWKAHPSEKSSREAKEEPEDGTRLLTEAEMAERLGVSVPDVRRYVREKRLGCIRLKKRKIAFTEAILEDFLRRESGLSTRQGQETGNLRPPKPPQGISLAQLRQILQSVL